MDCNSFLVRVHGHVLWLTLCLSCVSATLFWQRYLEFETPASDCTDSTISGKEPFKMLLYIFYWFFVCVWSWSGHAVCCMFWKSQTSRFSSNLLHVLPNPLTIQTSVWSVCFTSFWPSRLAASLYAHSFLALTLSLPTPSLSPPLPSFQTMERCVSGRTSLTKRIQRWWRRGRAFLICCPLPEVSPPPALTVKTNALFYYPPPSTHQPIHP